MSREALREPAASSFAARLRTMMRESIPPTAPPALQPATTDQDAALLGPWAQAFARICGEPVVFDPLDPSRADAGLRMTFPQVFQPIELLGGIGHFQRSGTMVEHVRRMGFEWDENGRVRRVPAPGAFNVRLRTHGLENAGFQIAYANDTAESIPLGPWLRRYMGGTITVLVNAPAFYEALANVRPHEGMRWGLMSLAHDLSVHALNYHLVPHAAIDDLANRIRASVPERYAAWAQPETITPLTLTYFYDNDFNRYTYAVWCYCERPESFASIFLAKRNYDQLLAALEVRLQETKAGRGDVASGVIGDMEPLAETSFDVRLPS